MDSRQLRGARGSTPSFVQPLLNTLSSMRGQENIRPEALNAAAERLLWSEFGSEQGVPETGHAHATVDVMAEHTRYVDGFGLHLPVEAGCSVSVRSASGSTHRVCGLTGPGRDQVMRTLELLEPAKDGCIEAAVVSSIPRDLCDCASVPATVATVRAMAALQASTEPISRQARSIWERAGAQHGTISGILASSSTGVPAFILTDVKESDAISLEVPALERPGLALVGLKSNPIKFDSQVRLDQVALAVEALRKGPFPNLTSMRGLAHRDLEQALSELPRKLRSIVTFLVTEDGRVQKLVAAIQGRDWQMFGALLRMSHASKASDLKLKHPESDFIVKETENMILDGMYGATLLNSYSGAVLVAGQPFSVPPALERLRDSFKDRFGHSLSTLLL